MRYAITDPAGVVTAVVIAETDADAPDGHLLPDGSPVGPGWTHDGTGYQPPPPPPTEPLGPSPLAVLQAQIDEIVDLILSGDI